ncbi:MAG: branched-chain amino acid ABC transporter permease [Chloroflexi bacterium]|nr:branched-chain amino acid ABC transporter permease [Chloroflexota bacterium]
MQKKAFSFFHNNRASLIVLFALVLLPFIVGLFEGASPIVVWENQGGISKFVEGLGIEIFILALYALSYDLIFGVTGLLSFGHAMFFAVGAYLTGIALKSFALSLPAVIGLVFLAAILQALLFGLVLPRVKGITFALVTLGMASMFHIIVTSSELGNYTGADVGLQGVMVPSFINPANERLRFYFVALVVLILIYLLYQRFVNSPTGRVCVAIRENEGRAKMLGYNTFAFKLAALMLSSFAAALAGVLHALYQPIVSPNVADLSFTVTALLIVLIGGVGTLSGALIGAFVYRLLDFGLRRYIGENASFITGTIYVAFVLFIPYGMVGTWRLKSFRVAQGWRRLLAAFKT